MAPDQTQMASPKHAKEVEREKAIARLKRYLQTRRKMREHGDEVHTLYDASLMGLGSTLRASDIETLIETVTDSLT